MNVLTKRRIVKFKKIMQKRLSLFLAILLFFEVSYPTQMMALTGGPSQPEVQSFEPIGTSDMVDLFSGDFNYNLPLIDVEGYPINLAYHSGVNTDQEASWVGLGWNINPGVINRNMRGLPDDYQGDIVSKEFNMKPNKTWGVAADVAIEIFGGSLGFGSSYGFNFNNYSGPTVIKSFNVNVSAGMGGGSSLTGGLGLTSSSDEGLTVQPSLGFSAKMKTGGNTETSLGVSVGTAFNSRGGLKQVTINASASVSRQGTDKKVTKNEDGTTTTTEVARKGSSASLGSQSVGGTFDFGQQTYSPKIDMPMKNFSMSGSFTLGGELWGVHGKIGLSGFYSAQELAIKNSNNPAYGYLYAQDGQFNDDALMDFNREKDGTFTENTPALPLTNFTFDTYGVSGQGIGGSYRPFRGDIGYVFDNQSFTTNDNDALTVELGFGGYVHVGTNVTLIDVFSKTGKWKSDNPAIYSLTHTQKGKGNDFENVYFKEANEKTVDSDPNFYNSIGKDNPVRFDVNFGKFNHAIKNAFVNQYGQVLPYSGPIKRSKRDKKTQNISFLKKSEYSDFAIDDDYNSVLSAAAKPHHIAEVTTLGTDGSRYIYGIAAYNNFQQEITFSVGSSNIATQTNSGNLNDAAGKGIVTYSPSDNSLGNSQGLDNYYSKTETPSYAHSYLLTSVLSADYIDADNARGPSDGDYGSYTKFKYVKKPSYKWRVPVDQNANKATFTEGLKSDFQDDKANVIYGEKDLFFLDSIITKNYVAVFHKSNRLDALGVSGVNGAVDASQVNLKLDSISLYSKRDLSKPLKRVHFEYTYDLCPNVPNSLASTKGKLTLKKVYFTYQNSNRARLSPYVFDYNEGVGAENPAYNVKAYNRWGNYKPNNASTIGIKDISDATNFVNTANLSPSDFPYVEQNKPLEDIYCSVWNLKKIHLPSGGTIKVNYESDDYAYVQDKQAGQMFKIINYVTDTTTLSSSNIDQSNSFVNFAAGNGYFIFKAHNGIANAAKYISGISNVYFRFLQNIKTAMGRPCIEYVSGYGQYKSIKFIKRGADWYGCLQLQDVNLKDDNSGTYVNPVLHAGINFGKIHLPKVVWDATSGSFSGTLSGSILQAMVNSSFIKNIRDAVTGPTQSLYQYYNVAQEFVAAKSWIRLNNPDGHKLGGGSRVKRIEMIDNWTQMVGAVNGDDSNYGQEYIYNLEDGRSSGVAAYEPQLGGDENPFRQPKFVNTRKLLVPDDQSYVEEPFGESFFPSASVGYSRVTVKNIDRTSIGVKRHATGKVVHEFYTAKDFPTITKRTDVKFRRGKDNPGSLNSLLKINVRDYFAATQGFAIELNDMHGKPKSQKVYQEDQNVPITSVEYKYKCDPYLGGSFKLRNDCKVVEKSGAISTKDIGMFFDMVADFREARTETNSTTIALNVDVIPILGYPVPIPMIWPGFAKDKTRFRSATLTKVVQRFGILDETIAKDLGSVVSTKNLAYDAETGDVLLTQTTTNYNDKIYSFKYPAWWYYSGMGPSYQNLGYEENVNISSGLFNSTSPSLFMEGDEVALTPGSGPGIVGWVNTISGSSISVIQKNGNLVPSGSYNLKLIRSGKKNNLTTDMATITTLTDPLTSLLSNSYQNVLQASAVEFSNKRKAHCDCISKNTILPLTTNPYVNGTKGTWRPLKSYTHLTNRSQSNLNNNSNIRKDGMFESYNPYYKLTSGSWQVDSKNWTYVSEVSEFNVFGQEVENKDALGRYSSATFGYNQTMALSVAANSQFKEQGFDGFEDYKFNPCIDDHFKFLIPDTVNSESHTGLYSIKVAAGTPVTMTKQLNTNCVEVSDCNLELSKKYVATEKAWYVTSTGGTLPFNISYNILSGASSNPQITITASGIKITSTGPYTLEVTVTDDKGCTKTILVTGL